jgi:peptidoglycan biosynthesis protein MviN/MurJ (putative lipid II flippase)
MHAPEWNALLIAVAVGIAFWAAIELLLRWSAARRNRRAPLRIDATTLPQPPGPQPDRND